jgi:hypothetical protein
MSADNLLRAGRDDDETYSAAAGVVAMAAAIASL